MFIWQRKNWPRFTWDQQKITALLSEARLQQGILLGMMSQVGLYAETDSQLENYSTEAMDTSRIEGETLDLGAVRSSITKRMGMPEPSPVRRDARADGVVAMLLDATKNHSQPLTAHKLFGWHSALFPTGYSGLHRIHTGGWRTPESDPLQVLSGPVGHEKVHYEAPPAASLASEMSEFLKWFNHHQPLDGLVRAAIAHLWFVTIHPFEDGNGRIARAITDMALAQSENSPRRFYSMSHQIHNQRTQYYNTLERTQKGDLDITSWLLWFCDCFKDTVVVAQATCRQVLKRSEFWNRWQAVAFTARQRHVLVRLMDNFEGKLTVKKWAALGKCSVPTAQRDIHELVTAGVLTRNEGGSKNTSYQLN